MLFVINNCTKDTGSKSRIIKEVYFKNSTQVSLKQETTENSAFVKETGCYRNGNIEYVRILKANKMIGPMISYYENGKIKTKEFWFNGRLWNHGTGCYEVYYENGKIERREFFYNGNPYGTWSIYDNNGLLYRQLEYVTFCRDGFITNQEKYFNTNGQVIKSGKGFYFSVNGKDTINLGDEYEISIKIENSFYDDPENEVMYVYVGKFNKCYDLLDTTSYITIYDSIENFTCEYKYKPVKKGQNIIRGNILEYYKIDSKEKDKNYYFTKYFYVK